MHIEVASRSGICTNSEANVNNPKWVKTDLIQAYKLEYIYTAEILNPTRSSV